MDIFDAAQLVSTQENPLTAPAAGKLIIMRLERHATVKEVPRGGARASRGGHMRAPFDEEGFGVRTNLDIRGDMMPLLSMLRKRL